jgi:hypothetical protein
MRKGSLVLVACVAILGCSGESAPVEQQTQPVTKIGGYWDLGRCNRPNGCSANGSSMHCCRSGEAMAGIYVGSNSFYCVALGVPPGSFTDLNCSTQSRTVTDPVTNSTMLACPAGKYMKGFSPDQNKVICCDYPVGNAPTMEFFDRPGSGNTKSGYLKFDCSWDSGHTCPINDAAGVAGIMQGIHVGSNILFCGQ